MGIFDVFTGERPSRKTTKSATGSSRGGLVLRDGMVVRQNGVSVLFFDDSSQKEVFIPLSQVTDWWFTSSGSKQNLRLADLELDDEVTLVIPRWLAKKERMV